MNPLTQESDAMAAYLAARRAGVSLEEQGKLWVKAVEQEKQHMQEKTKQGAGDGSKA